MNSGFGLGSPVTSNKGIATSDKKLLVALQYYCNRNKKLLVTRTSLYTSNKGTLRVARSC